MNKASGRFWESVETVNVYDEDGELLQACSVGKARQLIEVGKAKVAKDAGIQLIKARNISEFPILIDSRPIDIKYFPSLADTSEDAILRYLGGRVVLHGDEIPGAGGERPGLMFVEVNYETGIMTSVYDRRIEET